MSTRHEETVRRASEVMPGVAGPAVGRRWTDGAVLGVLALLAALPYANTLFNAFVYDDNMQVLNNPYIQNFGHLREIFTTTVWSYVGVQGVTNYYRPMMTLGYLLCHQLFGPLAYGFHLVNVLLHAGVTCALFLLTVRLFGHRGLAFVAAGLFALHPVHTESVAWVAAVTDLELTFFYLLTFWFFLGVARPGGGRSAGMELAMVGGFVLTMLSKEQALTLPVLATVYEHFYRDDRLGTSWSEKFCRYGWLWLLAAAYLLFRIRFFGALAPVLQISNLTWWQAILSALALLGQYLWKLLWPVRLSLYYPFRESKSLLDPPVLLGFGALLLCLVIFFVLWRRARLVSFGLVWLLVTLLPVLNVRWMSASVFAERYLYLPSVGFCWLVAWGWLKLWEIAGGSRAVVRPVLVAVLVLAGALSTLRTITRNRDWQTDIILYTGTLAVWPDALLIRNNLGMAYWAQGNVRAAEREWLEVMRRDPDNMTDLTYLGMLYAKEGRFAEAEKFLRRALEVFPRNTTAHLNLGAVYAETGSTQQAESHFRAAIALSPLNSTAHNELGRLCWNAGRLEEAERLFRRSVEIEPNVLGYDGLGDALMRRGVYDEAEGLFKLALSLDPFDSHARFGLGENYAASGRIAEAMREYQAGLATDPHNPEALAALEKLSSQEWNAAPSKL